MNDILEFIDNFRTREVGYTEDAEECVRHLFRSGYCYYFAKILAAAYPGGNVCLAYPFGHFVYYYNGKAYDIEGEYDGEAEAFVPEEFMTKDMLLDFMHLPNNPGSAPSKEEIEEWYEKVKNISFKNK